MNVLSNSRVLLATLAIGGSVVTHAYLENFDTYATNSNIIGQGGWRGWDNDSTLNATLVNTRSVSAPNSIRATNLTNVVRPLAGFTSGKWVLRVKQYVPSTSVGEAHFVLFNRYSANNHPSSDWSVELVAESFSSTIHNLQSGDVAPLIKDAWVEIKCEIDLTVNHVNVYYNGALLTNSAWQTGGLLAIGAVQLYAFDPTSQAFYDDLTIDPAGTVETLAPVAEQLLRGQGVSGNLGSWSADDNNPRVIKKFFVINQIEPFVRVNLNFTTTKPSPTSIGFETKARMIEGGLFQLSLGLLNKTSGQFDLVQTETAVSTNYSVFSGSASGDLSRYVGTGNSITGQIAVRQVGPSASLSPQASFEAGSATVGGQ
jgi:hypothetical protein